MRTHRHDDKGVRAIYTTLRRVVFHSGYYGSAAASDVSGHVPHNSKRELGLTKVACSRGCFQERKSKLASYTELFEIRKFLSPSMLKTTHHSNLKPCPTLHTTMSLPVERSRQQPYYPIAHAVPRIRTLQHRAIR